MEKNLDGIQKINPGNIDKSRNIVLDSIGEKTDSKEKRVRNIHGNKMDGIFAQTKKTKKESFLKNNKIESIRVDKFRKEHENFTNKYDADLEKEISNSSQKDNKSSEKNEIKYNKHSLRKEKKVMGSRKKNKKKIKNKFDFNKRLKTALANIRSQRVKISNTLKKLLVNFNISLIKSLRYLGLLFLVSVIGYMLLVAMVTSASKTSGFTSFVADKIFIPAVISGHGILAYDQFLEIRRTYNQGGFSNFNLFLAREIVLQKLLKKHNLKSIEQLREIYVYDHDINLAPFQRIKKIKETINQEGDFVKAAGRLGSVGQTVILRNRQNEIEFADQAVNLKKGETSEILTTQNGYYIVHCFDKDAESLSVSFVHIEAVDFDKYLSEEAERLKYYVLTK